MPDRGVVVLGMHRSGTSAVARAINLMGVPINIESDWVASQPDNPRGYWESATLIKLNTRVLALFNGSSINPPPLPPGWQLDGKLDELTQLARATFRSVFADDKWVWKDPRACLTLPFWRQVINVQSCVLVYRHPLEVAASLSARDGLSVPHCLALWERYVRSSLVNVQGLPTFVISYDDLVERPDALIRELRDFLVSQDLITAEVDDFAARSSFVGSLRHHRSSNEDMAAHPAILPTQRNLFKQLEQIRGVHEPFRWSAGQDESPWVADVLCRIQTHERMIARVCSTYATLHESIQWVEAERQKWEHVATDTVARVRDLEQTVRSLQDGNAWLEQQRSRWEQAAREGITVIRELEARLHAVEEAKAWLDRERLAWERTARDHGETIAELQRSLDHVQAKRSRAERARAGRIDRTTLGALRRHGSHR
jgi:hypothetical protein